MNAIRKSMYVKVEINGEIVGTGGKQGTVALTSELKAIDDLTGLMDTDIGREVENLIDIIGDYVVFESRDNIIVSTEEAKIEQNEAKNKTEGDKQAKPKNKAQKGKSPFLIKA